MGKGAFDNDVLELEQVRRKRMLSSRGLYIEIREVESTVGGLKRNNYIQGHNPEKQQPEEKKLAGEGMKTGRQDRGGASIRMESKTIQTKLLGLFDPGGDLPGGGSSQVDSGWIPHGEPGWMT